MRISKYKIKKIDNRIIYSSTQQQKIIDNAIHHEIKNKYRVQSKSRDYIIDAVLTVMRNKKGEISQKTSLTVLRLDIKNFFDSINKHKLYQKINRSMMLKEASMDKIKEIVFTSKIRGLPQGVSFSSSLSDIYLEEFDQLMPIVLPNVLLYERFVDDIIVILYGNHKDKKTQLLTLVSDLLEQYQLKLNDKTKLEIIDKENKLNFSYLGYSFESKKNSNEFKISVSKEKTEKYLAKIRKLFSRYYHSKRTDEDYYVLFYSLRNLLWTIETKKYTINKNISFGFKHNYKRINDYESFDEINKEIRKQINSSRLFKGNKKQYLHSLMVHQRTQKYNFNTATTTQLQLIADRLNIPKTKKLSKEQLVKSIFNKLSTE